ncbi:pilus assembly protein PilZ [Cystobacter fuscus]|uniref:Pilus assembly protein PilZ n=1 Tax=Cystobacter fuscus TaxID=43 RepID=A0A250JGN4_9BACT|nr:PilZ domain-containing protein [Cystobacter fuscus]ATB43055.1 pilus assembly protein PilZ [Cystobacter fuscus]
MDFSAWLANFRNLHERARRKLLTSEEYTRYLEDREQLARTLLKAQGQTAVKGISARRTFRVPKGLPVDVCFREAALRSRTLDLSSGGFSCTLTQPPDEGGRGGFVLWLPGENEAPVVGRARIVARAPGEKDPRRVSFSFEDVSEEDRERLEMMIFDLALGYIRA